MCWFNLTALSWFHRLECISAMQISLWGTPPVLVGIFLQGCTAPPPGRCPYTCGQPDDSLGVYHFVWFQNRTKQNKTKQHSLVSTHSEDRFPALPLHKKKIVPLKTHSSSWYPSSKLSTISSAPSRGTQTRENHLLTTQANRIERNFNYFYKVVFNKKVI